MFDYFCFWAILSLCAGGRGEDLPSSPVGLPSWIVSDPAFQRPVEVDSIKEGKGSLATGEKKSLCWVVHLNEEPGHGVHVNVERLSLDPDAEDFLMVAPWPTTSDFMQAKLFTGQLSKGSKVRIPNTKSFLLFYKASKSTANPELVVDYHRYGVSYQPKPPPTEGPVKKNTIYEVQLKGKGPEEYAEPQFLMKVKEAMRATAQRYSLAHKIPFESDIPTKEMVFIRRVSFCPFEWPERDICSSLEHSIFVSGVRVSDDLITNYELTADHLREMWMEEKFPELEALGLTVYKLPTTSVTVLWWSLILGLMFVCSMIAAFIFWRMLRYKSEMKFRKSSAFFEAVKPKKKSKLKLAKHQEIPPFMFSTNSFGSQKEKIKAANREDFGRGKGNQDALSFRDSSGLPIKNYFGSVLFSSNSVFEEEEEHVEFRRK